MHGGVKKQDLILPDSQAVAKGVVNLVRHIRNIKEVFSVPLVVALNHFVSDTEEEIREVQTGRFLL